MSFCFYICVKQIIMFKKLLLGLLFCSVSAFSQNRKGEFKLVEGSGHRLYVCFEDDARMSPQTDAETALRQSVTGFAALADGYDFDLEKLPIAESRLDGMEAEALKISGSSRAVNRLRHIFEVKAADTGNANLHELAQKLEALDAVVYCSLIPTSPIAPPADILPITPNLQTMQNYIGLQGVNMDYAWNLGLTGQGVNIRDIEYGVNTNHEDLSDMNIAVGPNMTIPSGGNVDFHEHGTAVFGVLMAHKGTYGVSGLCHGANEGLLYPEVSVQAGGYNRVYAITKALENSFPGNIVLYEMQTWGAYGDYCPAEYENVVWDLTKAATDAGVVIIAAAGNGAEDLDMPLYQQYRNRGDSGATIVGAGSANILRQRLSFSTYGARVDVQGWGVQVMTTGYGDVYKFGNDINQAYTRFSGTSSATPVVSGCAVVLQSYYHSLHGTYMNSQQMRHLLKSTGLPQGTGAGHIGPLPNMMAAVPQVLNDYLSTATHEKLDFGLYPNPVQDRLTLMGNTLTDGATAAIYNSVGQLVYSGKIVNNEIATTMLAAGFYTLKVTDGGRVATKKIIKK